MTDTITPEVEDVTAADVATAQAAADEAAALVAELEDRVVAGDEDVTPDEITAQEGLSRFARLRAEATRRKAEASKVGRRLRALQSLKTAVDTYAIGSGHEFAELLRSIKDAEAAFIAAIDAHNEKVQGWYFKAEGLGTPVTDGRPVPPAEDGRLALGRKVGDLHAGSRWLTYVDGKQFLETSRLTSSIDSLFATLELIDAEIPEPDARYFYRGSGGTVIGLDRPANRDEIANGGLKTISRKEAWGE